MNDEDEPLDPQIEALRIRLMRLMRGGLIFGLGALVLMLALIYRFAPAGDRPSDIPGESVAPSPVAGVDVPITLPQGARLVDTAVGTDRLALTLQMPDGRTVIRVVNTSGREIVSYRLEPAEN